jgi:hypothetical protein
VSLFTAGHVIAAVLASVALIAGAYLDEVRS